RVFFFSSRRRHTRSKRDWSSDVCSSDLTPQTSYTLSVSGVRDLASQPNTLVTTQMVFAARQFNAWSLGSPALTGSVAEVTGGARSEERRVGKEWRGRWWGAPGRETREVE